MSMPWAGASDSIDRQEENVTRHASTNSRGDRSPRIVIIGAGFGGIGMAVRLKQEGFDNFVIFERYPRSGGVWVVNDYPGADVDTYSEAYRLGFHPYPWTRSHAKRDELLSYFDDVIATHDIGGHIRYSTEVDLVEWNENSAQHRVLLADGSLEFADIVISAVGFLGTPRKPDIDGLEKFAGRAFHSSQWDYQVDLTGKHVAVVGTGSSTASIVPAIADQVGRLDVYQRSPGWVLPKAIEEYDEPTRSQRMKPLALRRNRVKSLMQMRALFRGGKGFVAGSKPHNRMQRMADDYLESTFKDRPDLLELLRPDYPVNGKRIILNADFYEALKKPNVHLIPHAVKAVTPTGVIDQEGVERHADLLVLSTGFTAAEFLSSVRVRGENGQDLHENWAGDPRAFLGLMVPGFPNFFIIYGPNTSGAGALLAMQGAQFEFIIGTLKRMLRSGRRRADLRPGTDARYQRWLDKSLVGLVFDTTENYYKSEASGRTVTQWPKGFFFYMGIVRLARPFAVRVTRPRAGRLKDTAPHSQRAPDAPSAPPTVSETEMNRNGLRRKAGSGR